MSNIFPTDNNNFMKTYKKTDNIILDMKNIIDTTRDKAYQAVNLSLIQRNWLIGYRISEEVLDGETRAEYGAEVIKRLSKKLSDIYGKGFTKTNLYSFYSFYNCFPKIFHSSSGKYQRLLSWTHYRLLIQVHDEVAREWYAKCRADGHVC